MGALHLPPVGQQEIFYRGLLGGLTTDTSQPTPLHLTLLRAMAKRFHAGLDVDALEPATADEVAAAIEDPAVRSLFVSSLIALEFAMHPLPPAVERNVEAYARVLGVEDNRFAGARALANGQAALLHADILRNSWYTKETVAGFGRGVGLELIRSKAAYFGAPADRAIATRWEALADCPPGTWGRGVADFYAAHAFPFPGERHGIYEVGARHDWVHVLADYPATPEGEIDVFAFIAASMAGGEGQVLFLVTLCLFQNNSIKRVGGKRVVIACADTLDEPGAADRLADAFYRGQQCTADVMAGIDHFAHAERPLDEVRRELNVLPKSVPGEAAIPDEGVPVHPAP